MTVDLYTTTADPRELTKSKTAIASGITCKPAAPFSILNPRIILSYSAAYAACNYVYIGEFSRYYFATPQVLTGNEIQLDCSVDALSSYDLSNVPIMCVRSESTGINYCPDNKLPIDPEQSFIEGKLFPNQPLLWDSQLVETDNYLVTVNAERSIL